MFTTAFILCYDVIVVSFGKGYEVVEPKTFPLASVNTFMWSCGVEA